MAYGPRRVVHVHQQPFISLSVMKIMSILLHPRSRPDELRLRRHQVHQSLLEVRRAGADGRVRVFGWGECEKTSTVLCCVLLGRGENVWECLYF